MIPNTYLLKAVLIAILITIGIVTVATAQPKCRAENNVPVVAVEVSPSVFDSFVQ